MSELKKTYYVKKERPKVYLSNKDLYKEIIISKAQGKLTRGAENMLMLLGKNVIKKFYYKDIDDKHDCLQNGYIQIFSNWYNFDEEKGTNCFAYFTEIFKRGIAAGWKQVNKGRNECISMNGIFEDGGDMNI